MRIKEVDGAVKLVPMVIDAAVTQARRDQVEAYMRAQATLLWKATEDITYCFSRTTEDPSTASSSQLIKIKAGRTYMGVPYAYSMTTPTSFLDYAGEPDANNIYPISGLTYKPMSGLSTQTRVTTAPALWPVHGPRLALPFTAPPLPAMCPDTAL